MGHFHPVRKSPVNRAVAARSKWWNARVRVGRIGTAIVKRHASSNRKKRPRTTLQGLTLSHTHTYCQTRLHTNKGNPSSERKQ